MKPGSGPVIIAGAIVFSACVVAGAILFSRGAAQTFSPEVSEYQKSLARLNEVISAGTNLPTFRGLTVNAGAAYTIARPYLSQNNSAKCGDGLTAAKGALAIWTEINESGVGPKVETMFKQLGVQVDMAPARQFAQKHVEYLIEAAKHPENVTPDIKQGVANAEAKLNESYIGQALGFAGQAVSNELINCISKPKNPLLGWLN